MKYNLLYIALITCITAGCTLPEVPEFAEKCPDAEYYSKADGTIDGQFSDPDGIYYDLFEKWQACPVAYPTCYVPPENSSAKSLCHETCRANEIFCGLCINPMEDNDHCGAKGLCTDDDADSEHYIGKKCENNEVCRNGICECGSSREIHCGNDCVDPDYDMAYCGARGLCNNPNPNSKDYRGKSCDKLTGRCSNGECRCGRETDIACDGKCIDPVTDINHCGAKGFCSDSDPDSVDYQGEECFNGQKCSNGVCICARESDIICGHECIDPENDIHHCGAKGLCSDNDAASEDYIGQACGNDQRCIDGQCVCARETDIECNGECIDPDNNNTHCGAKGLCTDTESGSDNFIGSVCGNDEICRDGACVCSGSKQISCNNTCIDPAYDLNYCGARGLCTDDDSNSENYHGQHCRSDEICRDGVCTCGGVREISCSETCIDPKENSQFCGARGLCTDDDPNSDDYHGQNCRNDEICRDGVCTCAANREISCNNKCIDPESSAEYCGAKGLCTDSESRSENYHGQHCRSDEICRNGICTCAGNREISCNFNCIDPMVSSQFCGAKGLCIDENVSSDNYYGQICRSDEICRDGLCSCAGNREISCNETCVDPEESSQFCGARGLCTDEDINSENYHGQSCRSDEICKGGLCACARNREISCNETCVDPNESSQFCGAKGLCTDEDVNSENYRGQICREDERCQDGTCVCARNREIACNNICIDPFDNVSFCGAKGLCSDSDPASADYIGEQCLEGQICDTGVCKCSKTHEIVCNDECIDPRVDKHHCGAKGLCTVTDDMEDENFAGGECTNCEDGVCICPKGYHNHNNTCEINDIDNCGSNGNTCDLEYFPHATGVDCVEGKCVATGCAEGAFFAGDGRKCTTCSELVQGVVEGDYIMLGHFRQFYDKAEAQPIEWKVLDTDPIKGVLVISRYVLENRQYNTQMKEVTWEQCTLRSYLNGYDATANDDGVDYSTSNFIHTAFNDRELECIQPATVHTPDLVVSETQTKPGGNDTTDYLFVLSRAEANTYFKGEGQYANYYGYATTYASHNTGLVLDTNRCDENNFCTAYYWLRSPASNNYSAGYVHAYGYVGAKRVDYWELGVRPVMRLIPSE